MREKSISCFVSGSQSPLRQRSDSQRQGFVPHQGRQGDFLHHPHPRQGQQGVRRHRVRSAGRHSAERSRAGAMLPTEGWKSASRVRDSNLWRLQDRRLGEHAANHWVAVPVSQLWPSQGQGGRDPERQGPPCRRDHQLQGGANWSRICRVGCHRDLAPGWGTTLGHQEDFEGEGGWPRRVHSWGRRKLQVCHHVRRRAGARISDQLFCWGSKVQRAQGIRRRTQQRTGTILFESIYLKSRQYPPL